MNNYSYGQTPMFLSDKEAKKIRNKMLTEMPLDITFIDADDEKPEKRAECLLKINLKGDAAGYYDDVFIIMTGTYIPDSKQWFYYDVTGGRYPLDKDNGEVVGWRYVNDY